MIKEKERNAQQIILDNIRKVLKRNKMISRIFNEAGIVPSWYDHGKETKCESSMSFRTLKIGTERLGNNLK